MESPCSDGGEGRVRGGRRTGNSDGQSTSVSEKYVRLPYGDIGSDTT